MLTECAAGVGSGRRCVGVQRKPSVIQNWTHLSQAVWCYVSLKPLMLQLFSTNHISHFLNQKINRGTFKPWCNLKVQHAQLRASVFVQLRACVEAKYPPTPWACIAGIIARVARKKKTQWPPSGVAWKEPSSDVPCLVCEWHGSFFLWAFNIHGGWLLARVCLFNERVSEIFISTHGNAVP